MGSQPLGRNGAALFFLVKLCRHCPPQAAGALLCLPFNTGKPLKVIAWHGMSRANLFRLPFFLIFLSFFLSF
jgi:hypothetical protein